MQVELTRDEVELLGAAVDMWHDSSIDTKRDLEGAELAAQDRYVEDLGNLLFKLESLA